MDERPNKSSPVWVIVIVLLLASVPLYILSTGPALWLHIRGAVTREQLFTVYAPLIWLEMRNETCRNVLEGYLSLWKQDKELPQPP